MNTPAHLLLGAAVFGKKDHPKTTLAAVIGALLPDLSLYLMAGISLFVLSIPPQRVFGELYYSDAWQQVFAIDNSFVLWGAVCAVAIWRAWPRTIALSGAALLHLALDFPLHHDDTRRHFWPLSDWEFQSPVSYWDAAHHGNIMVPISLAVVLIAAAIVARRHKTWGWRAFVALCLGVELFAGAMWLTAF